uniref:RAVE complex protein Rav1 C-terminal domain-containing protein n=1 Tax=Romanomermis culicivorax TaxID=13658 RepID=A0A915I9Y3_ROMCU
MDAAVYYLAMKKKNVIMHLYRSARDNKMMDFFANDFTQDKWKKAALKNAFVLMGKQRFEHAVAFFLLGNAFEDALQVCVNNLNDLQLALVIVRLNEQNVEKQQMIIRKLLSKRILGLRIPDEKSSQSAFVSSYVTTNGDTPQNQSRHSSLASTNEMDNEASDDPFLRSSTDRFIQVAKSLENQVTPLERKLYFKTASVHFKTGCPLLALEVLCKLPKKMWPLLEETIAVQRKTSSRAVENVPKIFLASSSASPPQLFERPDSDLKLDIMAQQLKFIACLKIIMEELSTLASLNEVDGGQLRIQLYSWLEKEVDVLKYLCEYNVDFEEHLSETFKPENNNNNKQESNRAEDNPSKSPVLLHEALKFDRLNMNAKLNQSVRRRLWLGANQQLLRTLLSYCSLHSSQGVGLTSVRMEILLLLQELHQDPSRKSVLAAPLPVQSSFPLLAASVASIKTDIAGPLRYLHCQISDLLKSFCDLQCPPKFNEMSIKMSMFYMLSQGLSSCIYESLCDVDNLTLPKGFIAGHGYLLRRKRRKSSSFSDEYHVTSSPHKWPGTENLLACLSRERDEDVPNLLLLLAETWVAIYLALFAYSFCSYDSRWLYRLVAHPVDADTFAKVFGGGAEVKSSLGLASEHQETSDFGSTVSSQLSSDPSSTFPAMTALARTQTVNDPASLRARFNAKVFGVDLNKNTVAMAAATANRKQSLITTTKNHWVQPKMSIITHFMARPMSSTTVENVYNSDASQSDDDESDDEKTNDNIVDLIVEEEPVEETHSRSTTNENRKIIKRKENTMHADPDSFAWLLLRFAVVKQAIFRVNQFMAVCGFEVGGKN